MRVARISSQAFAEAIRWLTGQMPQMRAISAGISSNGRPSQNFSNPRNCVTWNCALSTRPSSLRCKVIRECPSMRVMGSITIVRFAMLRSKPRPAFQLRHPSLQQLRDREVDRVGRRRAAWHEHIHLHHFMDGAHPRQQLRHTVGGNPRVRRAGTRTRTGIPA